MCETKHTGTGGIFTSENIGSARSFIEISAVCCTRVTSRGHFSAGVKKPFSAALGFLSLSLMDRYRRPPPLVAA